MNGLHLQETDSPSADHDQFSSHNPPVQQQEEETDLLGMLRLPEPLISCCDTVWFLLVTIILTVDIVTDISLMIIYGINGHFLFLGVSIGVFVFTAAIVSIAYAIQMRYETGQSPLSSLGCMLANCPLQIGLLCHRILHAYRSGSQCCQVTLRRTKADSNIKWIFIKLDLIHGVLNCSPQICINILHMLVYKNVYILQYVSMATSFALLLLATVLHEKLRKERVRNYPYGCLPMICILLYRSLVISGRLIAFSVFLYYFGVWLCVILLPHLVMVTMFFTYLYRQVWKVQYYKIFTNSIYCLLAYYPIHCEYRPEGEIVMYYILHLVENIIMVGVPYFHVPSRMYDPEFKPWSDFHTTSTLLVLLFSAVGLIFMGTYYFFFHGAKETISDTNHTWLAKVCEWTKRTSNRGQPFRVGLYNRQSNASTPTSFSNPLCPDPPQMPQLQTHTHMTTQPEPITNNVTSPLWTEPPQYHALYPSHANGKATGGEAINRTSTGNIASRTEVLSDIAVKHTCQLAIATQPLGLEDISAGPSVLCGEELSD